VTYLTIPEVAERIHAEHRTVRRAIHSGELEAALIGGRWLIREQAVDQWFQRRVAHRREVQTGSVARLRAINRRATGGG
jgi:excisionase family DNA binding protein